MHGWWCLSLVAGPSARSRARICGPDIEQVRRWSSGLALGICGGQGACGGDRRTGLGRFVRTLFDRAIGCCVELLHRCPPKAFGPPCAALAGSLLAGSVAAQSLACRAEGSAAVLSMKNGAGVEVVVPHRADICEAGFDFEPAAGDPARGRVILAPRELGLDAQQSVMSVDFLAGTIRPLGELPAAAERKAAGVYEHVTQEGGSLFLTSFKIDDDRVQVGPVSLELVFDGELCVDEANAVRVLGLGVDPPCSKRVQATGVRPVCLVHRAASHHLVALGRCRPLMNRWQQR